MSIAESADGYPASTAPRGGRATLYSEGGLSRLSLSAQEEGAGAAVRAAALETMAERGPAAAHGQLPRGFPGRQPVAPRRRLKRGTLVQPKERWPRVPDDNSRRAPRLHQGRPVPLWTTAK